MTILTNNPRKIVGIQGYGLEIVDRMPLEIEAKAANEKYLSTKRDKLGHFILNEKNDLKISIVISDFIQSLVIIIRKLY